MLAWALCAVRLALIARVVVLGVLNPLPSSNPSFSIVGIAGVVVGGVVASCRPQNVVGWLLIVGALLSTLRGLGAEYAVYGLITHPDSLPAAPAAGGSPRPSSSWGRS